MSLRRKPHTAMVQIESDDVAVDKSVRAPVYGVAQQVKGMLQATSTDEAFKVFGVELNRPHIFYADLSDKDKFGNGARVEIGGRWFRVVGAPIVKDAADRTNYVKVLLEEYDITP